MGQLLSIAREERTRRQGMPAAHNGTRTDARDGHSVERQVERQAIQAMPTPALGTALEPGTAWDSSSAYAAYDQALVELVRAARAGRIPAVPVVLDERSGASTSDPAAHALGLVYRCGALRSRLGTEPDSAYWEHPDVLQADRELPVLAFWWQRKCLMTGATE